MTQIALNRRSVLMGSAAMSVAAVGTARAEDTPSAGSDGSFQYEVTRSAAEWRDRLTEDEYEILRDGQTEFPFTSPYASENNEGTYHCRGCDLNLFESRWYSPQAIGFAFFEQSVPNAILTGVHENADYNGAVAPKTYLEVHCRRCGSHMGHIVSIDNQPLYCINGTALDLKSSAA